MTDEEAMVAHEMQVEEDRRYARMTQAHDTERLRSPLTVPEVAERLGRRRETIRRWIHSGRIRGTMLGRTYRVTLAEVERVELEGV